jgi:transposase
MSHNRLAIHLTNSEWGVSKETGECSKSHILAEEIINSSLLLKNMREAYNTFREVLYSGDELKLDQWLEKYKSTNIKRIRSFINGINHDLEAIKNAIKYPWSNGVVEGHVNRLKNKKREMYGRAGFELLRRKVVLSNSG